jgi:hypothetical protein
VKRVGDTVLGMATQCVQVIKVYKMKWLLNLGKCIDSNHKSAS